MNYLTPVTVDQDDDVLKWLLTGLSPSRLRSFTEQAVTLIERGFARYQQLAEAPPAPPAREATLAPA